MLGRAQRRRLRVLPSSRSSPATEPSATARWPHSAASMTQPSSLKGRGQRQCTKVGAETDRREGGRHRRHQPAYGPAAQSDIPMPRQRSTWRCGTFAGRRSGLSLGDDDRRCGRRQCDSLPLERCPGGARRDGRTRPQIHRRGLPPPAGQGRPRRSRRHRAAGGVRAAIPSDTVIFCDANAAAGAPPRRRQFLSATRAIDYTLEQPCATYEKIWRSAKRATGRWCLTRRSTASMCCCARLRICWSTVSLSSSRGSAD